jgi:hypothetical protein
MNEEMDISSVINHILLIQVAAKNTATLAHHSPSGLGNKS